MKSNTRHMKRAFSALVLSAALTLSSGCSKSDQERARLKTDQATEKTKTALHRLGSEAKEEAHKLNQQMGNGLDGTHTNSAGEAGAKLDSAGIVTKVKAKLAANVGLASVTSIHVEDTSGVVTLTGTVGNAEQKREAATLAGQVAGVSRVVNSLTVEP